MAPKLPSAAQIKHYEDQRRRAKVAADLVAGNAGKFAAAVKKFAKKLTDDEISRLHQVIGMDLLEDAVMNTRVETGRARGNWQVTIGSPAENALEVTDKNGNGTITAGSKTIDAAQPFTVIWISNNVEYILALEEKDKMLAEAFTLAQTRYRKGAGKSNVRST